MGRPGLCVHDPLLLTRNEGSVIGTHSVGVTVDALQTATLQLLNDASLTPLTKGSRCGLAGQSREGGQFPMRQGRNEPEAIGSQAGAACEVAKCGQ